jgi:hypothetical protein
MLFYTKPHNTNKSLEQNDNGNKKIYAKIFHAKKANKKILFPAM